MAPENRPDLRSVPASRRSTVTYEQFLSAGEEFMWTEWIDGEVVAMTPVGRDHQKVAGFLLSLLRVYVEHHRLGEVLFEPFQMKTGPDLPGRAPDIMFVGEGRLSHLKDNYLDGPADLVVEIASPASASRDRGAKFREYETGGVREYWVIDPVRRQAEFYVRGEDACYHRAACPDGVYRSVVLGGLWLDPRWLWQDPLPRVMDVVAAWKLI
jgi:Uma2 family endonuclease